MGIEHSGIFGMRWGRRRYQNPDGTYTPEGLERKRQKAAKAEARALAKKEKHMKKATLARVSVSDMSDDELRKLVSRMQLEKQYVDIMNQLHPEKVSKLSEFMSKFGSEFMRNASTRAAEKVANMLFPKKESAKEKAERMRAEEDIMDIERKRQERRNS